jgi:hypothetical protein
MKTNKAPPATLTPDRPKRLTKKEAARESARAELQGILTPGQTVYCILRHVSRSGMYRRISFYILRDAGPDYPQAERHYPYYLDRLILEAGIGDAPRGNGEGVGVSGCGMDMGFHVVYSLSRFTFPDGFAPSEIGIRPSDGKKVNVNIGRGAGAGPMRREEMADKHAKGWKFPGGRNGNESGWDNDGGYALKQRWM